MEAPQHLNLPLSIFRQSLSPRTGRSVAVNAVRFCSGPRSVANPLKKRSSEKQKSLPGKNNTASMPSRLGRFNDALKNNPRNAYQFVGPGIVFVRVVVEIHVIYADVPDDDARVQAAEIR